MPIIVSPLNGKAEAGQDHFAFEHCGRKRGGTFLDIGCNEPIRWNNTYALEHDADWRGWGFDIEPGYADMWKAERKSTFVWADAANFNWSAIYGPDGESPAIDYLSLDIDESAEKNITTTILRNLIAAGLTFRCATIEHDAYNHGDNPRLPIREIMQSAGYKLAHANVEIRLGNGKPFEDWWVRA